MLVAAGVTAIGLLLVGIITQLFGYRLGGTITVPVLAVYTLKSVYMLPVFVFSTVLAYVGLWVAKQYTLIYGRDELLIAMGIGSGVPLIILTVLGSVLPGSFRSVVFIGSILPGLAAFNYHQLKIQYRRKDLLTSVVLFCLLFGLGYLLLSPRLAPTLGTLTPPALYTATTDITVYRGAVLQTELEAVILRRPVAVVVFLIGLLLSERVRSRYGLRIGLISVALLAVYSLASIWLLVLYGIVLAIAYLFLRTLHHVTLLYGRVLISVTTAFAMVTAVLFVLGLPVERGLSAYFVGILAGINAYNLHTAPAPKRKLFVPLQLGCFTLLLILARATGRVLPRGFPQSFGVFEVAVGVLVVLVCVTAVELYSINRPSRDDVFEASILSGGDGQ